MFRVNLFKRLGRFENIPSGICSVGRVEVLKYSDWNLFSVGVEFASVMG